MKDFQQAAFSGKHYAGDCVFPVSVGVMAVPLPVPPIAGKAHKASQSYVKIMHHSILRTFYSTRKKDVTRAAIIAAG
jgi:hypothetical protein